MKKITITNAFAFDAIKIRHSELKDITGNGPEEMDASDGYHTFTELYDHRIALYIALLKTFVDNYPAPDVWRSKLHHDGSSYEGWFILGKGKTKGQQISYHLPLAEWENTDFAETLENAPEWDGHTPYDVVERLRKL